MQRAPGLFQTPQQMMGMGNPFGTPMRSPAGSPFGSAPTTPITPGAFNWAEDELRKIQNSDHPRLRFTRPATLSLLMRMVSKSRSHGSRSLRIPSFVELLAMLVGISFSSMETTSGARFSLSTTCLQADQLRNLTSIMGRLFYEERLSCSRS